MPPLGPSNSFSSFWMISASSHYIQSYSLQESSAILNLHIFYIFVLQFYTVIQVWSGFSVSCVFHSVFTWKPVSHILVCCSCLCCVGLFIILELFTVWIFDSFWMYSTTTAEFWLVGYVSGCCWGALQNLETLCISNIPHKMGKVQHNIVTMNQSFSHITRESLKWTLKEDSVG